MEGAAISGVICHMSVQLAVQVLAHICLFECGSGTDATSDDQVDEELRVVPRSQRKCLTQIEAVGGGRHGGEGEWQFVHQLVHHKVQPFAQRKDALDFRLAAE